MSSFHRLASCAALLLASAAPLAHGAGAGAGSFAAAIASATTVSAAPPEALRAAGGGRPDSGARPSFAPGLSTRLGGGCTAAVRLTRAAGAGVASVYDRYSPARLRIEDRFPGTGGHRALALTLNRSF